MLRQLFDTVNGKYQKSKKIATDSNYLRCHALLTALHFPLETTWSCKQDRKERYWGQQFWQMESGGAKVQVTGHRSQVRSQGHRSQATGQVIGHTQKQ